MRCAGLDGSRRVYGGSCCIREFPTAVGLAVSFLEQLLRGQSAHAEMVDYGGIPLDETFIGGGEEMDRPGDPAGSAWNAVNCRCTLIMRQAES